MISKYNLQLQFDINGHNSSSNLSIPTMRTFLNVAVLITTIVFIIQYFKLMCNKVWPIYGITALRLTFLGHQMLIKLSLHFKLMNQF